MEIEKIFWAIVLVTIGGFFVFLAMGAFVSPANAAAQNTIAAPSGNPQAGAQANIQDAPPAAAETQVIALSYQNGIYQPYPITVKVGVPVRLVADMNSITGCMTTVAIPEFGVRKTLSRQDNIIEFTPIKSGTFDFTCGMGMGKGKLVVENADGSVAAYSGAAPAATAGAHTCGGSASGGCGCGG